MAPTAALQTQLLQLQRDRAAQDREQTKAETLQRVFYRIAERATAGLSLFDFLQTVHSLLGELLYAKNCYVCLYNAQAHTLDFPYYVDERDGDTLQRNDVAYANGLTEFVLRTAQPQLISAERFIALQASGDVTQASGDLGFSCWLGVPMLLQGNIAGALVVQSYEPGIEYTDSDADILSFVANHFSSALDRYRVIEDLRKSEERYRSVIENIGVGVVVVQDGRMVFVNPSLVEIVGHSQEFLLSHPFTATIHPDDLPTVVQRHQRRLRGETVEMRYGFRVLTQAGKVRWLELSAVVIEWNQRDATLLFAVDATERMEAEQTKQTALHKQIELSDLKSRFVTMASHEFRTPLATIHGSVELLQHYQERMPAAQQQQTLKKINDAVERMTHMLENVLVIGRADAGKLQCIPRPLAITPFCLSLLDELRSAMATSYQRVQWTLNLPAPDAHYLLDETLVRTIVSNLLSNALKYSPDGGTISLTILPHGDQLVITVADQGIGIPLADQSLLFSSFHRASNVGAIAGTGLGLSIVQEAATCHGGGITLHSELGRGSCFTVHLLAQAVQCTAPVQAVPSTTTPNAIR